MAEYFTPYVLFSKARRNSKSGVLHEEGIITKRHLVAKSLKEYIHGGPLGLHEGSKNNKHQMWSHSNQVGEATT